MGLHRASEFLLTRVESSRDYRDAEDAGHYLVELGEFERGAQSLMSVASWLVTRGRTLDALAALAPLTSERAGNTLTPHTLGWALLGVGDAIVALGRLDEALTEFENAKRVFEGRLASAPSDIEAQRDLTVSHNKVGNVLVAQGRLDDALTAYRASLTTMERLARQDPQNAGWQRDLTVSHNKVGDVLRAQGRLDDALTQYRAGLTTAERLAPHDTSNATWQTDLIVSRIRVVDALAGKGPTATAERCALLTANVALLRRLAANGLLHGAQLTWTAEHEERLRALGCGAA